VALPELAALPEREQVVSRLPVVREQSQGPLLMEEPKPELLVRVAQAARLPQAARLL
jgi:hypothetical protein